MAGAGESALLRIAGERDVRHGGGERRDGSAEIGNGKGVVGAAGNAAVAGGGSLTRRGATVGRENGFGATCVRLGVQPQGEADREERGGGERPANEAGGAAASNHF